MGLAPWACGAMPMAFAPQGMGMQGMIGMQGAFPQTMPFCGPPNFEGPRFFAFPMAPVQQQARVDAVSVEERRLAVDIGPSPVRRAEDPNMAQMGQSSSADWGQFQVRSSTEFEVSGDLGKALLRVSSLFHLV